MIGYNQLYVFYLWSFLLTIAINIIGFEMPMFFLSNILLVECLF